MVNGIRSLISLSYFPLIEYRNPNNCCVLILYSATLLNSLISSSNFVIVSFKFYMCSIMSSANRVLLLFQSVIVVQSLNHVQLFVTPWTAAHQALFCAVFHYLPEFVQTHVH